MKRTTRMYGIKGRKFGIWDSTQHKFVWGICEDTPMLAEARLWQCIGDGARKWRYEARILPPLPKE